MCYDTLKYPHQIIVHINVCKKSIYLCKITFGNKLNLIISYQDYQSCIKIGTVSKKFETR